MDSHEHHKKIEDALERHHEAHFWLHGMESHYHVADPFRWHLNAFLKALDEVPTLLSMKLQNEKGFPKWFRAPASSLRTDPLIDALAKHRDFVVHRGMLVPSSKAFIGVTEGRGLKAGMSYPINPLDDSDQAMDRYLELYAGPDFLGVLTPDEDSVPCVFREWHLPQFKEEIVEVCARAWLRVGETMLDVLKWLGGGNERFSLDCRHGARDYRFRTYDRDLLIERRVQLRSGQGRGLASANEED